VVLSIRGTVSVADLATDMLADPEPMEEWLPDTMTEVGHSCSVQSALHLLRTPWQGFIKQRQSSSYTNN